MFTDFQTASFTHQGQFYFVPRTTAPTITVPESNGISRPLNDIVKLMVIIYLIASDELSKQPNNQQYQTIVKNMALFYKLLVVSAGTVRVNLAADIDIFIKVTKTELYNMDFRPNFEKMETASFIERFLSMNVRPFMESLISNDLVEFDPTGKRIDTQILLDVMDKWYSIPRSPVSTPLPVSTPFSTLPISSNPTFFAGGGGGGSGFRRSPSRPVRRVPVRRRSPPRRSRPRPRTRSRPPPRRRQMVQRRRS